MPQLEKTIKHTRRSENWVRDGKIVESKKKIGEKWDVSRSTVTPAKTPTQVEKLKKKRAEKTLEKAYEKSYLDELSNEEKNALFKEYEEEEAVWEDINKMENELLKDSDSIVEEDSKRFDFGNIFGGLFGGIFGSLGMTNEDEKKRKEADRDVLKKPDEVRQYYKSDKKFKERRSQAGGRLYGSVPKKESKETKEHILKRMEERESYRFIETDERSRLGKKNYMEQLMLSMSRKDATAVNRKTEDYIVENGRNDAKKSMRDLREYNRASKKTSKYKRERNISRRSYLLSSQRALAAQQIYDAHPNRYEKKYNPSSAYSKRDNELIEDTKYMLRNEEW